LRHRAHDAPSSITGLDRSASGPRSLLSSELTEKEKTMTAQKGKDLLVKIASGAGYTTVAGLRTRRLAFNAETVDITHAESANRWRELLDGAGVKRASVSGRGLFKDASSDALMRQAFFDGSVVDHQIVIPDFGTVKGPFQITGLEIAGEHNGEVTYDMSLESAGELTFTVA
jgi:TP901-1 family phage major tail protein